MSKLFTISEEEKNRILNLHESATGRQYLTEQEKVKKGSSGDPYEYMEKNGKYYFRNIKNGETKWTSANERQSNVIKTKIFSIKPVGGINNIVNTKKNVLKSTYQLTPRIDQELKYIKQRGMDDSPFFIYDPKDNLIYLFNKGAKLVDYSQVVDGADQQKDRVPMTLEMWCKISGLGITPYKCTNIKTKQEESPKYAPLVKIADRFIPKGIYKISYLTRHSGYEGKTKNMFKMQDKEGNTLSAAIHGIPNLPERLEASKDLESILKKDISTGKVPKEYLNSIEKISNANQSFGCVGVPQKFIDNPNVQKLALNAKVFVMGDQNKSYLVQNSDEFFDKLQGNGIQCVDPVMLAQSMSDNNSAVA